MERVINRLNYWLDKIPAEMNQLSEEDVSTRPYSNKWSKKEILGHLCDSAIHNLYRVIKIQIEEPPFLIKPYNQEKWVVIQDYHNQSLESILALWCSLNSQMIKVIRNIPDEKRSFKCVVGNTEIKTLEWLIQDYLDHLEHHIKNQLLN
ncbi:DinB family protein [Litchfieldia alkalitelluris]|uniref:DinB family protein n=1 Tax=Litchfieldia alkalitelluris TaxID=304268 RepID=UPI00099642E6|nr:DinB family protein [Litchfieldia alkalitelluris]